MKPAPPVTRNRLLIKFSNTEGRHERFKKRKTRVLFGDHGVRRSNRPWDRQVGVVPPKASIAGWRVEVINFIGDLGIWFKRAKAMCKTARHEELLTPSPVKVVEHHRP